MSDMAEVSKLIEAQGKAFHDFKAANDERLKAVESKGYAPADLVQKVDAINGDITKLSKEIKAAQDEIEAAAKKQARIGATGNDDPAQAEYKQALMAHLRTGIVGNLSELEKKAMSGRSDPDGGFLVGREMDAAIDRVASAETAFRRLANVRTIGGASYKKLVKTRGVSGGWVGETEDATEGTAAQYSEIEIVANRVYSEVWIPNDLLEDAEYNLEADVTEEAGITFGETEGSAFISGDGVKKPRGILSYSMIANASYSWGKVGFIVSGGASSFAASAPADKFIDLQHALKQRYRNGAVWLMSDATLATVRQFKDASGSYYLWNPDPTAGASGAFLGSPVETDDYMPAVGAGTFPVLYANLKRAYTIVDRRGVAVIRDNVTKKGITKMHLSKRVGGGITHFEAVKALKIST